MKKLVASCSILKRANNRNPNFQYRKNYMNNYANHFVLFHQLLCHKIMDLLLNDTYLKILSLIHPPNKSLLSI